MAMDLFESVTDVLKAFPQASPISLNDFLYIPILDKKPSLLLKDLKIILWLQVFESCFKVM